MINFSLRERESRDLEQLLQNGAEMIEVYAPLRITFCTLQPMMKIRDVRYKFKTFISQQ